MAFLLTGPVDGELFSRFEFKIFCFSFGIDWEFGRDACGIGG